MAATSAGDVEHLVIVGDQAVPAALVQRDDQRSVVQVGHSRVNAVKVHDIEGGGQVWPHRVDQRCRKVLVERKPQGGRCAHATAAVSAASCRSRSMASMTACSGSSYMAAICPAR